MNKIYTYSDIISEYFEALQRIDQLTKAPEDLFLLKPDSSSWSANETFRHLRRFNNLYIRKIENILRNQNLSDVENGTKFKPKLISRLIIHIMEPPYKVKIPTLAPMYPKVAAGREMKTTTDELKESNDTILKILEELKVHQVNLDNLKGSHPVFKFLPMSLTDLFLVMSAHQRRHFWQAEQTLFRLSGVRY